MWGRHRLLLFLSKVSWGLFVTAAQKTLNNAKKYEEEGKLYCLH
jgi:hypothetical protein